MSEREAERGLCKLIPPFGCHKGQVLCVVDILADILS